LNNNSRYQNINKTNIPTNNDIVRTVQNQDNGSDIFSTRYIQGILKEAIGYYVIIEFLIGSEIIEKKGYIVDSGVNFVTLYDPETGFFVLGDMYSIKFVNFTDVRNTEVVEEFRRRLENRKIEPK